MRVLRCPRRQLQRNVTLLWTKLALRPANTGCEYMRRPFLQNLFLRKKSVPFYLSAYKISLTEYSLNYFILKCKILLREDPLACKDHNPCKF